VYVEGNNFPFAEIGISQVVKDGQVTNYQEDYPRVLWATNCQSMTFTFGAYSCFVEGRYMANVW
jgi:hypothetical protein